VRAGVCCGVLFVGVGVSFCPYVKVLRVCIYPFRFSSIHIEHGIVDAQVGSEVLDYMIDISSSFGLTFSGPCTSALEGRTAGSSLCEKRFLRATDLLKTRPWPRSVSARPPSVDGSSKLGQSFRGET
jgi:hypothetical protein